MRVETRKYNFYLDNKGVYIHRVILPLPADRLKNVKPATDSFMVLSVDRDLLETRRFQNQLTHQIHAHWRPENNSLNQGLFVRGQSAQEDVTPSPDAWLTFSGGQGEESEGVIDAFTSEVLVLLPISKFPLCI